MIAKNKVEELIKLHEGNIKSCFVTATQVYAALEIQGIKSGFWYKVIKELEYRKKNLDKNENK